MLQLTKIQQIAKSKLTKPYNYQANGRSDARRIAQKLDLHAEVLKLLHSNIKRSEDLKKQSDSFLKVADQLVSYIYGNSHGQE